jgi:hypothetical protein
MACHGPGTCCCCPPSWCTLAPAAHLRVHKSQYMIHPTVCACSTKPRVIHASCLLDGSILAPPKPAMFISHFRVVCNPSLSPPCGPCAQPSSAVGGGWERSDLPREGCLLCPPAFSSDAGVCVGSCCPAVAVLLAGAGT